MRFNVEKMRDAETTAKLMNYLYEKCLELGHMPCVLEKGIREIIGYTCPFCGAPNGRDEPGNCELCSYCGPSGV